ncbi:NADH dehydrogenase [ubiquinone] 1 subunit C2 [Callorhinchus milii]|uniref:NADH dehydrogenase [ubiquinone] 1 subunit C2 n=1 Tax=Callorhinchus milii TaxID=7868 RepID=K4G0E1_CALMI|nr:NADH dehydrogenase [ubiquinone] 1 subunit C2 [Callorhinchus milii]AFK11106.1 NADH dehydrogenase 1 subunit C2 [Callorhinchus milii]
MQLVLPPEARGLPPPAIVNRNTVWLGLLGWTSSLLHNALNHRPPLKAGIHRQILFTSVAWYVGYYLTKLENYKKAKVEHEMFEYIRLHPEDFPEKEKKKYAEILEDFVPIR